MLKLFFAIFYCILRLSFQIDHPCEVQGKACYPTEPIIQKSKDEIFTFKPINNSSESSNIEIFLIVHSKIPHWNTNVCQQFTNLESISLSQNEIQQIHEDVFQNCSKLRQLFLNKNHLSELHENIFKNLSLLTSLYLSENNFHYFNVDVLKGLENLQYLELQSNYLFEIDASTILKSFTKLNGISLNDNNFLCSRLNELESVLPSTFEYSITEDIQLRKRDYEPEYLHEKNPCLSMDQWCKEMDKENLEMQEKSYNVSINNENRLSCLNYKLKEKIIFLEENLMKVSQKNFECLMGTIGGINA